MREIKFRIFDNHEKRMVINEVDSYISFLANGEVSHESLFGTTVLMQYTGLKDKNGKEIYEGDIVKCNNGHIGKIEWENNNCCFNVSDYYSSSDDYPTMAFIEGKPFEVIGNIYESKDLLK